MNGDSFSTPILLLIYRRPGAVTRVMETLQALRPTIICVAGDGPANETQEEVARVQDARIAATSFDWPCTSHTNFQKHHLGCRDAVSAAITWFFSKYPAGIILEEDCVPSKEFFPFCAELLDRYRDNPKVFAISGNNFATSHDSSPYSYFFSRYPHCWGWATWARAWKHWNCNLSDWTDLRRSAFLSSLSPGDEPFLDYWTTIFDRYHSGSIDSWAYPWTYTCWLQSGLTILPKNNLVENIGFGDLATHTKHMNYNAPKAMSLTFPLKHPSHVFRSPDADSVTDLHHFGIKPKQPEKPFYQRFRHIVTTLRRPFLP